MAIFRQYIAPLLIVLVFLVALLAVGARIFLPSDMAAPAPIEDIDLKAQVPEPVMAPVAGLPSSLEILVKGLPLETDSDAL
jgi:hypothetical protein